MSVVDGKILLPTSIGEVAELLGENTRDLGRLCLSSAINKFSRSKPINHGAIVVLSSAERKKANNGLILPRYTSLSALRTAVLSGNTEWNYNRPTNRFRLTDFENYNHNASEWNIGEEGCSIFAGIVLISSDDGKLYDYESIMAAIDYEDPDHAESPLLYPSDWDQTSEDNLPSYYLGVALISSSLSDVWFRASSSSLSNGETSVSAEVVPDIGNNATWTIVPILTNRVSATFTNIDQSAVYIPLEGRYLQCYKQSENPNAKLQYSGVARVNQFTNSMSLIVKLKNTTNSSITLNDLYFVISSEGAYDSSWSSVEVAVNTWLSENKLDSSLPSSGGNVADGSGKVCQRVYALKPHVQSVHGSLIISGRETVEVEVSIPYLSDDYGVYDNHAYTVFLSADSHSGYDVTEFEVSFVGWSDFNNDFNADFGGE